MLFKWEAVENSDISKNIKQKISQERRIHQLETVDDNKGISTKQGNNRSRPSTVGIINSISNQ